MNPEDPNTTDTQKLLTLMKDQNKELKLNKKKLEKLEEKFIKTSSDNKSLTNDRSNIEAFLRNIFPKEMHDELIKAELGAYDSSDLSRLWLICESKSQNEYQTILSKLKREISELTERNAAILSQLDATTEEYRKYKAEQRNSNEQLAFYTSRFNEVNAKVEGIEKEKAYLLKVLDEKNAEIEVLKAFELENAELKAKSLLDNIETLPMAQPKKEDDFAFIRKCAASRSQANEKTQLKICKSLLTYVIVKVSLNIGSQTEAELFSKKEVDELKEQINALQSKQLKLKKEFSDYKEKSHKIILVNEENYNKILTQYETVKKELSQLLNQHSNESALLLQAKHTLHQPKSELIPHQFDKQELSQKVNLEYLKNVLLKYLEAIAIGNEFQSKLLENVIFTMLLVTNSEKRKLEEKRITSSFYYNLWFNAKAYLSAKIYGSETVENCKDSDIKDNLIQKMP